MSQEMLLQMRSIRKTYGGIHALKGVDLDLRKGETLGLIGENGAGKSTLMRILCGIEKPDGGQGEILFEDQEIRIANPHHAQELGIAMIPQELVLVPQMTVVENIFLGRETVGRARFLDKRQMIETTEKIMADLQSEHINPEEIVGSMLKADQQLIAIGRRLLQGGKIFIMDEPTSAFTEKETKNLFNVIRRLCSSARSVIFISHRLEEVLEICDRITILRDGEMITTLLKGKGVDKSTLIYHMVGSEIKEEFPKIEVERGREIFRAENIAFHTNQGKLVKDINFSVHQGEVVGITGLVGVGKTELGQAIMGLRRIFEGALYLDDVEILLNSPIDAARVGFGYVSEDRRGEGLVSELPSLHNMTINSLKKISRNGVILPKKERELGGGVSQRLSMKKEYLDMEAQQLSGGNQQKVVIVRQIIRDARIIIFDEPTKGIDVAAKREVARLIGELSKEKKAILLLSSEPREVLGISDTIFVLTKDGMEGPFPRDSIDYEQLMAIEFGKGPNAQ
jgi:ribose transport system ATP-binding protein